MPLSVWSAFLTFTCITAFTPGPNNILSLSVSSRFGIRGSFRALAGIGTGILCIMVLCGIVSYSASTASDTYIAVMRYFGCAYIVWLSWKVATASPDSNSKGGGKVSFFSGIILQFVNVKIMIYGLTAFSGFVLPYYDSLWAVLGFALILTAIGNAGNYVWALIGASLQRFLLLHGRIANVIMGVLLFACAIRLLF